MYFSRVQLVSVIIATFNRRLYLEQAIDSVLGQTFQDWDLIVIDDGSSDGTGDMILENYGRRVRYIRQENRGRSAARNHGMRIATGKYIAFLDSDDMWKPQKLERQVAFMEQHPEYGLTHTFTEVIDRVGTIDYASTIQRRKSYVRALKSGYSYDRISRLCIMFLSTVVVKADIMRRVGLMDEEIPAFEDWDWYLRAALVTEIGTLPEMLTCYRIHQGNSTTMEFFLGEVRTSEKHLKLSEGLPVLIRKRVQRNLYLHLAAAAYKREQTRECRHWFWKAAALDPWSAFHRENLRYTLTALGPVGAIRNLRRLNRRLATR